MEVIVISDDKHINRSDETSINHFPSLANDWRKSLTNSMSIKTYSRRDRSEEQVMSDERDDEECGQETVEWISAGEVTDPKTDLNKSYFCDCDGCSVVLKTLKAFQTHIKKDMLRKVERLYLSVGPVSSASGQDVIT